MRLVSVNVGRVDQKPWNKGTLTALHKSSVEGAVWLSDIGLEGDEQADTVNHGGRTKRFLCCRRKPMSILRWMNLLAILVKT